MNTPRGKPASTRIRWKIWIFVSAFFVAGMVFFIRNIYGFLATPTCRVDADVLVVEGWGGSSMIRAAAQEYQQGKYSLVVVAASEIEREIDENDEPLAQHAADELTRRGIPKEKIIVASPVTDGWNKTSKAAREACAKLSETGLRPKGINVVTRGPHSRRSRLAYQHAIGPATPVGVIALPLRRFDKRPWWTSRSGIFLVTKNLAGWLREYLTG